MSFSIVACGLSMQRWYIDFLGRQETRICSLLHKFCRAKTCFHLQVKYKFGELTAAKLKEAGVKLKFESYLGAHCVACFQIIRDYLQEIQTENMRLLA